MRKSIVGLVAEQEPRKVVSLVEKTLARKLRKAISEQASVVAKKTYGTLKEYYGGDEQPDYYNRDDNSYAAFFANALKKFGVNGPEDFTDEATKQQFFKYVDANWKAQDAVQGSTMVGGGAGGFENGTQTRLPSPAMKPMPPDAVPQGNEPSVATMAPTGPSDAKNQPLGADGDDPGLDMAQAGGNAGGGVPCPHCKGTGQAQVCPTCGKPMGDLDTDPDLEIGDDDTADDEGDTNFDDEPEDEMVDGGDEDQVPADLGDEDELEDDPEAADVADEDGEDVEDGDEDQAPEEDEDSDDAFDDEDAYSIDPSELQSDEDEVDDDEDPDLEVGDDDEADDDDSDEDDFESDDDGTDDDYDQDADEDEDVDDEDEDDEDDVPMKKFAEEYEQDNREDASFMAEAIQALDKKKASLAGMPAKKKKVAAGQVGDTEKRLAIIQKHLDGVKGARNSMLKSLKQQRRAIKKDASMHPDKKKAALKMIAQMAAENRAHFKGHAKKIKALHTGR